MSSIRPPEGWAGKQVATLDVLLFVLDYVRGGKSVDVFIGRIDVIRFAAFVDGIRFHLYCCGKVDLQFTDFTRWLRDEKQEFPPGGWASKYLADTGGDHLQAILRFLERCAEYARTHAMTP
jgi:hypothetical protein